jgi:hypothetical protein
MTVSSESNDISPPRDPAAFSRPRRGAGVWAIAALGVVCVILGFAGSQFVQSLTAPSPGGVDEAPAAAPGPEPQSYRPAVQALSDGPATPQAATSSDVAALEARLVELEAGQRRTAAAAGAALAAAALTEASQTSRPFPGELALAERSLPASAELRALRPLAETGAPSRAALADDFAAAAARASAAAREPADRTGFAARVMHALSSVVTIRRVGSTVGDSPDAVLARAERQVSEGDIDAALITLRRLPPKSAEALGAWRAGAQQRVTLDRYAGAVRAQALGELNAAGGSRP